MCSIDVFPTINIFHINLEGLKLTKYLQEWGGLTLSRWRWRRYILRAMDVDSTEHLLHPKCRLEEETEVLPEELRDQ